MADLAVAIYREKLTAQTTIVQRTSYGGPGRGGSESKSQYGAVLSMGVPAGAFANVTNVGVDSIKQSRDREKKDMQDLNERFASYIEKVRFLDAQKRELTKEVTKLKQKWGKETSAVKAMFQAELDEARKNLNDVENEKVRLEIRFASLEEKIEERRTRVNEVNQSYGERVEKQNQQLSDYEAEAKLVRRHIEMLENDRDNDKKKIVTLDDALERARIELDKVTLTHIDGENMRQTLEEELVFRKTLHEQEMKELAALAYHDNTSEYREYWKSEVTNAIREIQTTYEDKLNLMRDEMKGYYEMKLRNFQEAATDRDQGLGKAKEENKRLRKEITKVLANIGSEEASKSKLESKLANEKRDFEQAKRHFEAENFKWKSERAIECTDMEGFFTQLEDLMNTNLGIELEIAAYRKLLEGAENGVGFRQIVEMLINFSEENECPCPQPALDELAKGQSNTQNLGNVTIIECSSDGKYISLQNIGKEEENLNGWTAWRTIGGADPVNYNFESDVKISPNEKIKIWAANQNTDPAGPTDIEVNIKTWGTGTKTATTLRSGNRKCWAIHRQSYEK